MKMRHVCAAVVAFNVLAGTSAPVLAGDKGSREEAVAMVTAGLAHIKEVGKDKAFGDFMKPGSKWIDRDLYMFCVKVAGDEMIVVAHGAKPALAGKNLADMKSPDGKLFVQEFWKAAKAKPAGDWVDYEWPNPVTKAFSKKSSFVHKIADMDAYCGVGIYRD